MLGLIFKTSCILCTSQDAGAHGLCQPCLDELPWHDAPQCPQCGTLSNGLTCGNCLHNQPDFDATHALFSYDYPLDRLLQHYKYRESLHLANAFAQLWFDKKTHDYAHIDLIIPMPMHSIRLKQRGFNQALEIAKIISKNANIKLDYTACQRIKFTPPQATLPHKERIKNMRGVFECTKNLSGLNIAVIDDVMTTGASLNELAKTLKQAGAAHVECWVIARTLAKPYSY